MRIGRYPSNEYKKLLLESHELNQKLEGETQKAAKELNDLIDKTGTVLEQLNALKSRISKIGEMEKAEDEDLKQMIETGNLQLGQEALSLDQRMEQTTEACRQAFMKIEEEIVESILPEVQDEEKLLDHMEQAEEQIKTDMQRVLQGQGNY